MMKFILVKLIKKLFCICLLTTREVPNLNIFRITAGIWTTHLKHSTEDKRRVIRLQNNLNVFQLTATHIDLYLVAQGGSH